MYSRVTSFLATLYADFADESIKVHMYASVLLLLCLIIMWNSTTGASPKRISKRLYSNPKT